MMRLARIGRRGWVAAEFALVAPMFFLIALGTADLIRLFRAQLRTETIAVQIGQIVSQCSRIHAPGDVNQFWAHANRIAGGIVDINSPTGGAVVISAVGRNAANNPATNRLAWQIRTGNVSFVPSVGATTGGLATIVHNVPGVPAFVVPANQTVFVTEVFAIVQPWPLSAGLIGTALPSTIGAKTMFLSRARDPQSLQTAPTNSALAECTA
ncbi:MAG: pilus assembly protein [Sandarakinorhabdus sp.]|nr:pilus assembly protein [Sandarakinorhabdus sp.]